MPLYDDASPQIQLNGLADVVKGGSQSPPPAYAPTAETYDPTPRLFGMPLKYISLITLAVQNASLTIIMHYSRVSTPPSRAYSAGSAVLLNELFKGFISLAIAYSHVEDVCVRAAPPHLRKTRWQSLHPIYVLARFRRLGSEVFSPDCWKLSIPAILYVIQNNLQYIAASNLEAATFQVSYQMKILTTAAFSVMLLRRRFTALKWLALLGLAVGVGIVQIQAGENKSRKPDVGAGTGVADGDVHQMHAMKGFVAVAAACFTSGLAGVYFELVLKGSKGNLWVRNVQLSLFSLLPALIPILFSPSSGNSAADAGWLWNIFANFGPWAWATVATQVFGGLITAIVIKYSDNILKGFATSLSIVLSFMASVILFDFHITSSFVIGSCTVLASTWLYSQPDCSRDDASTGSSSSIQLPKLVKDVISASRRNSGDPIIGVEDVDKKRSSMSLGNPHAFATALGLATPPHSSPRSSLESGSGSGYSTPSYGFPSPTSPHFTPQVGRSPALSRMPSSTHLVNYANGSGIHSPIPTPSPSAQQTFIQTQNGGYFGLGDVLPSQQRGRIPPQQTTNVVRLDESPVR